jgi:hypothetical protein
VDSGSLVKTIAGLTCICLGVVVYSCSGNPKAIPTPTIAVASIKDPHMRFVIEGLRLGMSPSEVLSTLHQRSVPVVRIDKQSCVSDYIIANKKGLPSYRSAKNCFHWIWTKTLSQGVNEQFLLAFTEDYPTQPDQSVLTTLAINLSGVSESNDNLSQNIMNQFGRPSIITDSDFDQFGRHIIRKPWVIAMWCTTPCTWNTWDRSGSGTTLLVHRGSGLTLIDPAYEQVRDKAIAASLALHHVVVEH